MLPLIPVIPTCRIHKVAIEQNIQSPHASFRAEQVSVERQAGISSEDNSPWYPRFVAALFPWSLDVHVVALVVVMRIEIRIKIVRMEMKKDKENRTHEFHRKPTDTAEIRIWRHFRWSAWPCNSVKIEIKFCLECMLCFPCAQIMLRQMHRTNLSVSIEAKYHWVSWLSYENYSQLSRKRTPSGIEKSVR